MTKANGRTAAVSCGMLAAAGLALLLSACSTLGGPGPAICHAADGTMVPVVQTHAGVTAPVPYKR